MRLVTLSPCLMGHDNSIKATSGHRIIISKRHAPKHGQLVTAEVRRKSTVITRHSSVSHAYTNKFLPF